MPLRKQREGCEDNLGLTTSGKKGQTQPLCRRAGMGLAPCGHIPSGWHVRGAHGNEELAVIHALSVCSRAGHLTSMPPGGSSVTL